MKNQYEDSLRNALIANFDDGDFAPLNALFADSYTWGGWNVDDRQYVFTQDEFAQALKILDTMDASSHKLTNIWSIGDDIVLCEIDAFRKYQDLEFKGKMVNFFRFTDGRITHAGDICPHHLKPFWDAVKSRQRRL